MKKKKDYLLKKAEPKKDRQFDGFFRCGLEGGKVQTKASFLRKFVLWQSKIRHFGGIWDTSYKKMSFLQKM